MTSFLDELADHLLEHHNDHLRDVIVVLPARRAGLFLKRALARANYHGWLPELLTMTELTERMTGMTRADGLDLLFELFITWREHCEPDATFEAFLQWGPTALSDFNEIDHHRCDASAVFRNLNDFKEIEAWSFGEDESLWSHDQKRYARFWKNLGALYGHFQERMRSTGAWYGGAIARNASDDPIAAFDRLRAKHIVFAGLNALTDAEHKLIKKLCDAQLATYQWDADRYYTHSKKNEAGLFIRRYHEIGQRELPDHFVTRPINITLAACSGTITQMQYVGRVLSEVPEDEADQTAVILPDNSVLPVLLPALPEHFKGINVTMGRSLQYSPYQSLVSAFFRVLDSRGGRVRYSALLPFCRHPFISGNSSTASKIIDRLARKIIKDNVVFIDESEIIEFTSHIKDAEPVEHLFRAVFATLRDRNPERIIDALRTLQVIAEPDAEAGPERRQGYVLLCGLTARISRLCATYDVITDLREFERIYRRLFGQLQIDLVGEPLMGLQIMGLLESRALDFKRIIVVNANEDTLPRKLVADTFLPPDLRAFLQLPSARERDAYYAYYFYRLLQRAEEVHITYTTGEDESEKSRFIQQLETCHLIAASPIQLKSVSVMAGNTGKVPAIAPIQTGNFTGERIAQLLQRGLSPSALNRWLSNPREFFFQYILGLGEHDEVEEEIEHRTLGTLVHEVVEVIFNDHLNIALNPEHLLAERARLEELLDQALEKHYNLKLTRFGVNYLLRKVAMSFADKLLTVSANEAREHHVVVTGIEEKLTAQLTDDITLRGMADRVDRFDGRKRIIDYKTGKVIPEELAMPDDWQTALSEGKQSKLLQCLIYAWIAAKNHPGDVPMAGIISSRTYGAGFMPATRDKQPLMMDAELTEAFSDWVLSTIDVLTNDLSFIAYDHNAAFPTYSVNLGK